MSLDVTLGYPKMVFRVYRHVMIRRLVRNARKSSNPILRNLSCSYTTTQALEAIYFIAAPISPLAIVLASKCGCMRLWVNTRTREGFVRS